MDNLKTLLRKLESALSHMLPAVGGTGLTVLVVAIGAFAALGTRSIYCMTDWMLGERQRPPVARMEAEALAKVALIERLKKMFGTNGVNTASLSIEVRESAYLPARYVFYYRLDDQRGHERFVDVVVPEGGAGVSVKPASERGL